MQEINSLIEKYGNIGNGYEKAKCLLIIPKPICDPELPAAYGFGTPEAEIMKGIFTKLEIDPQDWWVTTAADASGVVSLPRLCDIVYEISPKLVVLAGRTSYKGFFGDPNDDAQLLYGEHDCVNYKVYHSMDFTDYLNSKEKSPSTAVELAATLFRQWKEIKELYDLIE